MIKDIGILPWGHRYELKTAIEELQNMIKVNANNSADPLRNKPNDDDQTDATLEEECLLNEEPFGKEPTEAT